MVVEVGVGMGVGILRVCLGDVVFVWGHWVGKGERVSMG